MNSRQEGTSTPETIVETLEELKKAQDNLIGLLKDIKQIMLELTEPDDDDESDTRIVRVRS